MRATLPMLLALTLPAHSQEDPRVAFGDTAVSDSWIYEDIDAGYAAAKRTGSPLLIVFR